MALTDSLVLKRLFDPDANSSEKFHTKGDKTHSLGLKGNHSFGSAVAVIRLIAAWKKRGSWTLFEKKTYLSHTFDINIIAETMCSTRWKLKTPIFFPFKLMIFQTYFLMISIVSYFSSRVVLELIAWGWSGDIVLCRTVSLQFFKPEWSFGLLSISSVGYMICTWFTATYVR